MRQTDSVAGILLFLALAVPVTTDLSGYRISRRATYVGSLAGVATNVVLGRLRWYDAVLGLLVIAGASWAIRHYAIRSGWATVIGKGDVRLLGVVGAFSGLVTGLLGLALAIAVLQLALDIRRRNTPPGRYYALAAGPWLALGGFAGFVLGAVMDHVFGVRLALR